MSFRGLVKMLRVKYGTIAKRPPDGCDLRSEWVVTGRPCWYVNVIASDGTGAIPMEFAREIDAEIAMQSINGFDSWEGTLAEIRWRLSSITIEKLKLRMVENLAW
jgi:hypothetical protein